MIAAQIKLSKKLCKRKVSCTLEELEGAGSSGAGEKCSYVHFLLNFICAAIMNDSVWQCSYGCQDNNEYYNFIYSALGEN